MPAWPFLAEVFLDEIGPLVVDGVNQSDRLSRLRPTPDQPLDLVFVRRIEKDVKCIRSIRQKECGAAPDNDAFPSVAACIDNAFGVSEMTSASRSFNR